MADDETPRFEKEISISTNDRGRIYMKMIDRINVDDVFLHLVNVELYRLKTGVSNDTDVDPTFKDFLLRERLASR